MVKRVDVEGYESVKKAISENSKTEALFVLFSGSKNSKGESWCPDCVAGNQSFKFNFLLFFLHK